MRYHGRSVLVICQMRRLAHHQRPLQNR
jgi:hypothetical protein